MNRAINKVLNFSHTIQNEAELVRRHKRSIEHSGAAPLVSGGTSQTVHYAEHPGHKGHRVYKPTFQWEHDDAFNT